ncbi:MAG: hypothetical protein NWR09_09370, partial [Pseudomonadales bacterium]|nr:hypothetical protein [Pseudomonadales bacterium]
MHAARSSSLAEHCWITLAFAIASHRSSVHNNGPASKTTLAAVRQAIADSGLQEGFTRRVYKKG